MERELRCRSFGTVIRSGQIEMILNHIAESMKWFTRGEEAGRSELKKTRQAGASRVRIEDAELPRSARTGVVRIFLSPRPLLLALKFKLKI